MERMLSHAEGKRAEWLLAAWSAVESVFFPLPPDMLLAPMAIQNRKKAFYYAWISLIFSLLGAAAGYLIGAWAFHKWGVDIITQYNLTEAYTRFEAGYAKWGMAFILFAAVSFFPFKLAVLASGALGLPFLHFMVAGFCGRGLRFFALAGGIKFLRSPPHRVGLLTAKNLCLALLTLMLTAMAAVYSMEYIGGLQPCPLCLQQRWFYWAGIALLLALLYKAEYRHKGLLLLGFLFLASTAFSGYHWGIEQGFWEARNCTDTGMTGGDILASLTQKPLDCATPLFQPFGMSLAAMNMLLSATLAMLSFWGGKGER